jgi:hypothetical protein
MPCFACRRPDRLAWTLWLPGFVLALASCTLEDPATNRLVAAVSDDRAVPAEAASGATWVPIFDGETLEGWTPKISGHALGENYADTFRVVDGAITVSYDGYDSFGGRFGHLFYRVPYSHYRLRFEYRIFGEPTKDIPDWAFRNSGVMYHSQPPETMLLDQDFPVSLELQLLRGRGDGEPRPTGNVCTPGTKVVFQGETDERHCIPSSSPTFDSGDWMRAELLVLGDERIVHYIDGEPVLEYEHPTYGGPGVEEKDPGLPGEGTPLRSGYIALQAEGHPIQFRNIELMDLSGRQADADVSE